MNESKRNEAKNCGTKLALLTIFLVVGWTVPAQAHVDDALKQTLIFNYDSALQQYNNGVCADALSGLSMYYQLMGWAWEENQSFRTELSDAIQYCQNRLRDADFYRPKLESSLAQCKEQLRPTKSSGGMASGLATGEYRPALRSNPPRVKRSY